MDKHYVMGIDNGTQSTKVVIFDWDGNEVAYGMCPLKETFAPEPGMCLHPDDDLWDSVFYAIQDSLRNFSGDPKSIKGIGLCTIRSCRILLKRDGSLAYPVMNWMDARLARPYQHKDDDVKYVTTTSGYIGFRLTGEKNDSAGNYEMNWPLDRTTWDWSEDPEVMKQNGLNRDMLFNLKKPGEKLGLLCTEVAEELGLQKNIPVVATSNDKSVEVLGAGLNHKKSMVLSLGTYISALIPRDRNYENAINFFPTLGVRPFQYVYESNGVRRGMWTVSWFKKMIGKELQEQACSLGITEEDFLNQEAEKIAPGSEGLITILDWLSTPDKPYRKGIMLGFDEKHSRYHMYRSILEAIAYHMKSNVEMMLEEINENIKEIIVIGGGAKSDLMMQILSDLFGLPVHRRNSESGAALGAAINVYHYLTPNKTIPEILSEVVKTEKTCYPIYENHLFYNKVNDDVVKQIRDSTDQILKYMYPIFG
ncbi:MAG TPA: FGGY family carbohydrate kinase [Pseudogracilibacillus sp.]|nr:FGGY family carbohydrate kinase [Pseudogracilibacillus sp.]